MKWALIWKVGKVVLAEAEKRGLKIKGVPVAEVEQKVTDVITSGKTLTDVFHTH